MGVNGISKYTTELRHICEEYADLDESEGFNSIPEIIAKSWEKVFDFPFEVFDQNYRQVLCKKIIMHYYTREIGFETVGLWKLKMQTKLNEIMPYYNKLYESTLLEYDPLIDADYKTYHEGKDNSNTNLTQNTNNSGNRTDNLGGNDYSVYSDTPQGALVNVANETYLTDARKNMYNRQNTSQYADNSGTNGNTVYASTDEYVNHVVGKFPGRSYGKLIKEFRESIINVDMMIIDELKDLFMLVW